MRAVDAAAARGLHLLELRAGALALLAREDGLVEHVEDHEQQAVHQQPRPPEAQGPLERDALQEAEEERRIAERREQPAAVRDDEDEEHDDVRLAHARLVGAQQRADQQHRRAGRADPARQHARRSPSSAVLSSGVPESEPRTWMPPLIT